MHESAILLISPICAVREVVTDEVGLNTSSVITTEVPRLLHLQVKIEGPEPHTGICAVTVQKIPGMEAERKIIPVLSHHDGEDMRSVGDLNNFPPGSLCGVNHPSLNITLELSRTPHHVVTVNRAVKTGSSQDEGLSRPGHLTDWTGRLGT